MLFLVPSVWAVYIQVLVRRSPPGAAITVAMGDILAAMDQMPRVDQSDNPFTLLYELEDGETWTYRIETTVSNSGDDIVQTVGQVRQPPIVSKGIPNGTYQATVLKSEPQGWLLEIKAKTGGSLPTPFRCLVDKHGNLQAAGETAAHVDIRDDLFRRTGIYLPGPFKDQLRPHDWCGGMPGTTLGIRTRSLTKNLNLEVGDDRMPPRGGLMFTGPAATTQDEMKFKILSYRRLPLERGSWEGFVELLVRADYHSPAKRIHLLEGVARLRDLIDLQKDRRIPAVGEYSLVIKQSVATEKVGG